MGCAGSKEAVAEQSGFDNALKEKPTKHYTKPKWQAEEPMTSEQLKRMREEFWDTAPHYTGDRVIWDALKAAVEADPATGKLILETAGIIVASPDMTVCYDERGAKYELPKYVLSDPTNVSH